ncbi:ABC transporter ATP-binding protein [Leucobacter sp. CSA1]|uniref:ABC transporter ATP-binding protein n=1 Tax=Leucobacter chromiisoli TaxID=2796471 RepID=A0A934Q4J4_9MICO|nr:ABC transporter ATP-binding protein [Leucobacter chromiisoli]MBK0417488.1 ABC transporter ATP-binding protein [Leucobacter chromiisoli]
MSEVHEDALLEVRDLRVSIPVRTGVVHALRGVDLRVSAGEVVGLVGESGGGKSMLARAAIGMLPEAAEAEGEVRFRGRDVLGMSKDQLLRHRGHGVAMCFQNPRAALEPLRTVRKQLGDRLGPHRGLTGEAALAESRTLLDAVGLTDHERVLSAFPHELSGGMAQRVMIALALACDPGVLLADEPTTGLDVTLTRDALGLLRGLADDQRRGVLLITHDLAAAAQVCDRIVVLRAGEVVEHGTTSEVLEAPREEYTRTLLAAVPDIDRPLPPSEPHAAARTPVVRLDDVHVHYRGRLGRRGHHALRGVSLDVRAGETVGVVGESGSGKTTLSRLLVGLVGPTGGRASVGGVDRGPSRGRSRALSRRAQMVFQDPLGALDPRRSVLDAITEPLLAKPLPRAERERRAAEVLARTGLDESFLQRMPHQLSGGQAQRVGIARALVADPELIVFDEPTSALDVTVQAQILDLVRELAADGRRAQLFVSHDLATVRSFCDRVIVVYLGEIVEEGTVREVFENPTHPYTRALLEAAPRLGGRVAGSSAV